MFYPHESRCPGNCGVAGREGYDIDTLHGDLTQVQRDKVMTRFREKSLQLLIATDVAARGIDVQGNYPRYQLRTAPDDTEVYTHRSGRTGRAGKSGISIFNRHPREGYRSGRSKTDQYPVSPDGHSFGQDVCRKQFFHFIDRMLKADISHGEYRGLPARYSAKNSPKYPRRRSCSVAALEFDRFLKYYENAVDLNVRDDRKAEKPAGRSVAREAGKGFGGGNYQRLFVNLGTKDGFYKASFLQFILDERSPQDVLGKVDLQGNEQLGGSGTRICRKMMRD